MRRRMGGLVFVAVVLGTVGSGRAEWQIGTVTNTRRVLREDPPGHNAEVHICAARNEWESFQILVRSDTPVPGVRIEAGDLTGPNGGVLPGAQAQIYRAHQLQITVPTDRNDLFRPGWYPDALIPTRHPLTGQPLHGRYVAMPFDLPAHETHGFWIDLHVPTAAQPGRYRGVYRVVAAGGTTAVIPVELLVWDFALPDTPTLQTAFGSPLGRLRKYYGDRATQGKEPEPADWGAVAQQISEMLDEHHINATLPGPLSPVTQADGSLAIPKEQVRALRRFVDRYHINAVQTPHPATIVRDPDIKRKRLLAWLRAWDQAAKELDRPQVLFYTYLCDEPNDKEAYAFVRKWGSAIRAAHSVVKVLVVEQPQPQKEAWGDLYGAVDIWCPLFPWFKEDCAAPRQALGELVWTYTALSQRRPTPWWQTDFPLLNYRVPTWISWRYGICGILYWGGMAYWDDVDDPWTEPLTLDHRKYGPTEVYNGEGTLLYPGRAVGYEGVAPSMRLKALRDSIEDYEYMAILARRGMTEQARAVVVPLAGSFFRWQKDPQAYEEARKKLAELILATPEKK